MGSIGVAVTSFRSMGNDPHPPIGHHRTGKPHKRPHRRTHQRRRCHWRPKNLPRACRNRSWHRRPSTLPQASFGALPYSPQSLAFKRILEGHEFDQIALKWRKRVHGLGLGKPTRMFENFRLATYFLGSPEILCIQVRH